MSRSVGCRNMGQLGLMVQKRSVSPDQCRVTKHGAHQPKSVAASGLRKAVDLHDRRCSKGRGAGQLLRIDAFSKASRAFCMSGFHLPCLLAQGWHSGLSDKSRRRLAMAVKSGGRISGGWSASAAFASSSR